MASDSIPENYSLNTPEQKARLYEAAKSVFMKLEGTGIGAVACVFAMSDGTITSAIVGDSENLKAMASIMSVGPEVLRIAIERMKDGKGETRFETMPNKSTR